MSIVLWGRWPRCCSLPFGEVILCLLQQTSGLKERYLIDIVLLDLRSGEAEG